MKEQELNQEPLSAAEPKTPVEVPVNPINPLNDNVNDYEKLKENGYAKDNVDEKDDGGVQEKDFMSSLILDDDFDEEEEYHFYEEGSASAYMERLRLQEEEQSVRSFLEEQEEM